MASAGDPVYNLTDRVQTFVTSPSDVPELDKDHCGFTAVEAMFTEGNTDTVVLKGTGNVSWISGKRPGPDPFPRETCGCKTEALRSEKKVFSGEALMEGGIVLPIMHGDYPCVQIYLNAPVS